MPLIVQDKFTILRNDLIVNGPYQVKRPNYSPLGNNKFHCHLTYDYVACWKWDKGTIEIEVYYVGSREKAPYDTKKSQR